MKRTDPTDSYFTVLGSDEADQRKAVCVPMSVRRRRGIIGDAANGDEMERRGEELEAWGRLNNIRFQFDILDDVRDAYRREYDRITIADDIENDDKLMLLMGLQNQEKYWFNVFWFDTRDDAFQFKLRWWS